MTEIKEAKPFSGFLLRQTIIIGFLVAGETLFFFFEQNYFNTYLLHVLNVSELAISLMVSLSATMGLVINLVWGIFSDNMRTKYGRRRPFLLFGGIIAGIAMIFFGFSTDYFTCVFIDVIIIGLTSNAYLVAERSLIPDTVPKEYRGRANGYISSIGNIGLIIAVVLFLLGNELFAVPNPNGEGNIIPQEGHLVLFIVGGIALSLCGIIGFLFIKEPSMKELPPKKGFIEDFRETLNWEELKNQKEFFKITFAMTVFRTGPAILMPFLFIYIFSLGLSTLTLGLGILISFPAMIFAMIYLGKLADKYGRKKFTPLMIILTCVGLFLSPFTKIGNQVNEILFLISLPFIMLALLGLIAPLNAWAQDLLPLGKRGQFYGILNIIFTVSQIVGAIVGGIVATILGVQWIFVFAPIFLIGSIPLFLRVKETLIKEALIDESLKP
jgi:MFS family permease